MLDWLIRGAQVLDGTGADAFPADVGIKDGTIAAVGRLTDVDAAHVLDAQGRTLTPGFLDIHRHTDAALFRPNFGRAELAQGLTTLVGGNCGMSLAPLAGAHAPAVRSYLAPITGAFGDELCFASLADYFAAAERTPQLVNNAMLAGMGTLRALVAGFDDAPLTDGQYRELHRLVERSLADGAVGVLTDTGYVTDEAADALLGVDLAVLEANHDIETPRSGPYPYYLKQRILGPQGHLSNTDAARFAAALAESGASEIILAHLSRENNTPAMAQTAVEQALSAAGVSPLLSVAPRDCLGPAHVVCRRNVCKR